MWDHKSAIVITSMISQKQAKLNLHRQQRASLSLDLPQNEPPPTVNYASKPFRGPNGSFSWDQNALAAPQVNKDTKPYVLDSQNRPSAERQGRRGSVETTHMLTFAHLYTARKKSAQPHIPPLTRIIPANVEPDPKPAAAPPKVPLLRKIKGRVNASRGHR